MSATPETKEIPPKSTTRSKSDSPPVMQVMFFFMGAFSVAVALYFLKTPPIFSAILIGVAIGFVTFYALGGIEQGTKFSFGPIKVTGSLAAIAAATYFINMYLEQQIIDPKKPLSQMLNG